MAFFMIETADILFQFCSHVIEGGRQLADFITGPQRQPCAILSPADIVGRFNQMLHRLGNFRKQE
ncbi:hypothetical protein D3C73_1360430 [compost metagenome]